jgi:uncharacterized protein involved in cysteine biosynthesis
VHAGQRVDAVDGPLCAHCGGAPREHSLATRARGFAAQVAAGCAAPFHGLSALFGVRGAARLLVPPTLVSALLLCAALVWLWQVLASATAGESDVDLTFWSWLTWLETPSEWVLNLPWMRAGGTLAFVLAAAFTWWFGYAVVFGLVAGPFLARMQARVEEHWLGARAASADHPFEVRGLALLGAAFALGAAGVWFTDGLTAAALFAAPTAVLFAVLPPFRAWLTVFLALEGRSAAQGLVVAAITGLGALLFLPFHLVPFAGQLIAAAGTGFFVALGLLDLALERRAWPLARRFAFARNALPALVGFGLVCGFVFGVPLLGPIVMLPAASLGGAWLVTKLDKSFDTRPVR